MGALRTAHVVRLVRMRLQRLPSLTQGSRDLKQVTFPERLKALRLSQGIPQTVAANAAGVHISTWRAWERGHKTPRLLRGAAIASALGVPVAALFRDDVVAEVVLSPTTIEAVRANGREECDRVAQRLAQQLVPAIWEAATKPLRAVSTPDRAKPRRTRAQVITGIKEAGTMRAAAQSKARTIH